MFDRRWVETGRVTARARPSAVHLAEDPEADAHDAATVRDAVALHDAFLETERALLAGEVDDACVAGVQHLEGCAELAAWLASVDVPGLGDFDLVEAVAGFERVAAWARARAADAAAELSERPSMNPRWPAKVGRVAQPCAASTELSLRLGMSPHAARGLVSTGRLLNGVLGATGTALDRGAVDWGKASIVAEALADVPWQVAHEVEAAVLPGAPRRTHPQLRRDLARALAEIDPRDAQERHARAVLTRRVDRPRVLADGMASIRAVLPAEAAVRLDATLHGAALAARTAGDPRTVDQLRADGLDAMAAHAWSTGWIGPGPGEQREADGAASSTRGAAAGEERGDASTATSGSEPVSEVSDATPRSGSDAAVRGESDATVRGVGVGAGTGDVARSVVGEPTVAHPVVPGEAPETLRVGRVAGRRAQVLVTVGLGTLIGADERPAELDGYGPVGADVARRIATEGTWRRLLTDPVTGVAVDVGRRRYRPPPDLAELVRARNPSCVFPTCSASASRCDLDHTTPHESGGSTTLDNLGPACRSDHLLKTHGGYRLTQPAPGTFELRTPTGHLYLELPVRAPGTPWRAAIEASEPRSGDSAETGESASDPPPPF